MSMKSLVKPLLNFGATLFVKPVLERYYLKKERIMKYQGVKCIIEPGVFHPGLFFSSKFLSRFITGYDLKNKSVLDLGCGSGFLSLTASSLGARVTAGDISPEAAANTKRNARVNGLTIDVIHSDLFERIEGDFDLMLINPPYFPGKPSSNYGYAWYCGEDFEYYEKLFSQLHARMGSAEVLMVLSDKCDLERIFAIAKKNQLYPVVAAEKDVIMEKLIIFRIKRL